MKNVPLPIIAIGAVMAMMIIMMVENATPRFSIVKSLACSLLMHDIQRQIWELIAVSTVTTSMIMTMKPPTQHLAIDQP